MQYADQPFYTKFAMTAGEDLFRIANSRGFDNPGPIIAYPPNKPLFEKRFGPMYLNVARDFRLMPGDVLYVPWHPSSLSKAMATSESLIRGATKDVNLLMAKQLKSKEDMNEFLLMIDAINFLANIGAGVAVTATAYVKAGFTVSEDAVFMFFQRLRVKGPYLKILQLAESRAVIGSNIATMVPVEPTTDLAFYVRHSLGPWNPSFWFSVWAAFDEDNLDYYLYGADFVLSQNIAKIQLQATRDMQQLRNRATAASQQLGAPFYRHRI